MRRNSPYGKFFCNTFCPKNVLACWPVANQSRIYLRDTAMVDWGPTFVKEVRRLVDERRIQHPWSSDISLGCGRDDPHGLVFATNRPGGARFERAGDDSAGARAFSD